jgi:hypothetical protein
VFVPLSFTLIDHSFIIGKMLLVIIGLGVLYAMINVYVMFNMMHSDLTERPGNRFQSLEDFKAHMDNTTIKDNTFSLEIKPNSPSKADNEIQKKEKAQSIGFDQNTSPLSTRLRPKRVDAVNITVAVMTGHYFDDYIGITEPCFTLEENLPLRCRYAVPSLELKDNMIDAFWYHAPHTDKVINPNAVNIIMSLESSINYGMLDDPGFMKNFRYKMTYRLNSDVPLVYIPYDIRKHNDIPRFEDRKEAAPFLNRNCAASDRTNLIKNLMKYVKIDSVGQCLHNADIPFASKKDLFKGYRVCVAIENSNTLDYVSEKLWYYLFI